MARFDVYANPDASERKITPYLVDVQNDYISGLATRVVIPMRKQAHFGPLARNLNPVFVIGADNVVLDTAALSAVPATELRKVVLNLHNAREPIQEALDTLFGSS
jgi:toxin CcdB